MGRITRTTLVFGGFVTALAVTLYPIAIHPFLNIARFQVVQKVNRDGVDQESIQPGGMKVWSNPFEPKK
ncbi:small integral membrane protein 20 [Lampetra fluviatilis]